MSSRATRQGTLDGLGATAERMIKAYNQRRSSDSGLSEKQKAEHEAALWDALAPKKRGEWARDYFLAAALGGSTNEYKLRAALHNLGAHVNELWRRIAEERMPLRTAAKLATDAKRIYAAYPKKYTVLSDALPVTLAEYDALPIVKTLSDGSVIRQRNPYEAPSRKKAARRVKLRNSNNGAPDSGQIVPTKPHELYRAIRHLVSGYMANQLSDVDEEMAEALYADFEVDLKLTIDTLREKIQTYRRVARERQEISDATMRKRLREAFEELAMDAPKKNELIRIDQVKRQYRKIAALYHPDKTPGIDLSSKFHAVTEAYNFICACHEQANQETV